MNSESGRLSERPTAGVLRLLMMMLAMVIGTEIRADESYPIPPESTVADGVPRGQIEGPFRFTSPTIYPGTEREYWVYVPAGYDEEDPPCLMVVQDGLGRARGWKLPEVLDNLIHSGDIPPQLGVFVTPGVVPAPREGAQPRFNRSFEYDSMGDRYANFLLEELLPEVRRRWNFSDDPNDRCIAGASSGAVCAFTVAWERPDQFRRVFSTIGTYVGLRGGNEYPTLVRKSEPRPIRVFLQDGSGDLNLYGGSWWHANQTMLSALQFSGYDVRHAWGEGGHNSRHGAAILPDALRWLWREYPEPITVGKGMPRRTDLLTDGGDWEQISEGHEFTEGPVVNAAGDLYFSDIPRNLIHRISSSGEHTVFAKDTGGANGLTFGPDGMLYACQGTAAKIGRFGPDGSYETVCEGIRANDLVILADGTGFCSEPSSGRIWRFTAAGDTAVAAEGITRPNGLSVSPDQTLLNVADTRGRFLWSFVINDDGQLEHPQEYGWLHVTDHLESGADGMTTDTEGRTYVATSLGIQVLDQPGRVHFIIRAPQDKWLSNVTFGGPDMNVIYATCGDKVYRRTLNATGTRPWQAPVAAPKPRL